LGYLKSNAQETDQLTLPSDSDYYVVMKRRAAYGDQLAAQAAVVQVDTDNLGGGLNTQASVDSGAYVRVLLTRLIVDWNLTDENEQPLPRTLENIERLDPEDGAFLADEANKRVGSRSKEQQVPFKNGSGPPSTVIPSATRKSKAS
jgi:hypothetical protein